MRSILFVAAALCAAGSVPGAALRAQAADQAGGPTLTLDEAIALATKNNPDHQQVIQAERSASARQRTAYGSLLPRADAQLQALYRQQGSQLVGGFSGFTSGSSVEQSSYYIGLTYNLNTQTFLNPRIASANVRAAEADITSSASGLRSIIARDYLTVLQDQAQAALQDSLIVSNQAQLELAKAKLAVGSGTSLDVTRAEVNLGTQQVAAIKAHNLVEVDKLALFQAMGVPQPANVQLTSTFEVKEPTFTLDSVLALAKEQNPLLNSLRARDRSASLSVTAAKSNYLPTLQLTSGWGGYTNQYTNAQYPVDVARQQAMSGLQNCQELDQIRVAAGLPSANCASNPAFVVTPAQEAAIRQENNQFPFNFTKQPFQIAATLSLPLFDNFQREQTVEEAEATRVDARYKIRAQELKTTADVTGAYLTLVAQAKTVALQEDNAKKAREELRLAQERYRVGASTFLDLTDARASFERAENDRINAIYEYHKAFAALESAVGRPLR